MCQNSEVITGVIRKQAVLGSRHSSWETARFSSSPHYYHRLRLGWMLFSIQFLFRCWWQFVVSYVVVLNRCGRLSWLMSAFERTLKIASRIVSYRTWSETKKHETERSIMGNSRNEYFFYYRANKCFSFWFLWSRHFLWAYYLYRFRKLCWLTNFHLVYCAQFLSHTLVSDAQEFLQNHILWAVTKSKNNDSSDSVREVKSW